MHMNLLLTGGAGFIPHRRLVAKLVAYFELTSAITSPLLPMMRVFARLGDFRLVLLQARMDLLRVTFDRAAELGDVRIAGTRLGSGRTDARRRKKHETDQARQGHAYSKS
jgi:hypothetical protein